MLTENHIATARNWVFRRSDSHHHDGYDRLRAEDWGKNRDHGVPEAGGVIDGTGYDAALTDC